MTFRNRCRQLFPFALGGATLVPSSMALAATAGASEAGPLISLTKLIGALALVLIVFWGFAWFMRQLQNPAARNPGDLRIVSALSIGSREKLVVIQAGSDQLLLGVTPSRIEKLHLLEGRLPEPSNRDMPDFRQKLSAAMSRRYRVGS